MQLFRPLRKPATALLWAGMSFSALGDQLYAVALTWIAVGVLGSGAGYLAALNAGVVLLAVLGLGRWADGWDQRRSMVAADLVRAAVLLAVVGAWTLAGGPSAPMLVLAVVALALGQAVFQPALQAVLPGVVEDARLLPAANGLLDTTERSARLLGPGLVGVLAAVVPVMHFLTLDAASFVVSAAALTQIGRLRPMAGARATPMREPAWRSIRRGVDAMRSHPLLGFVLSTTGWINGAWYAAFFLALPLLIERRGITGPAFASHAGSGLGAYGLIISAYGCTNLAATLVVGSRALPARLPALMFGGKLVTGAGMVLLGAAALLPDAWVLPGLAGAAAFAAVGGPMSDIPIAVLRQTRLPAGTIAAAMRATMAANSGGVLLAMLLAPTALRVTGPGAAIMVCGAMLLAVGTTGLLRHAGWQEQPASA